MSIPNNINAINALLEQASSRHEFDSTKERITFELGFLLGLLAKLMEEDNLVKHSVISKLDK